MTVFPTAGHLCSWARVAPRVKESGGRRKGGAATGSGNPYAGAALGEAAVSAGRTQTSAPSSAACAGTCPRRRPRVPS